MHRHEDGMTDKETLSILTLQIIDENSGDQLDK
jgi:hypothetical protein